jgi:outer membrane protein TolC
MREERSAPRRSAIRGLAALLAATLFAGGPAAPSAAETVEVSILPQEASPAALRVTDGAIRLTLEEAILMALRRNLGLAVERYNRAEAEQGIFQNQGIYDLLATADLLHIDADPAAVSAVEAITFERDTFNLGLSRLLPSGATVDFGFDNTREATSILSLDLDETAFDATATFSLRQPLLRGLGRLATERGILLARVARDTSAEFFEQQVASTIQQVENAYWGLVEARAQLDVAEESLGLARDLHEMNRIRVDVGTLAPLEMVQSEVGIATREEEIIRAQAAVGDAGDSLRRLINVEEGDLWGLAIVPETGPEIEHPTVDVAAAMATARRERPELEQQRLAVRTREIESAYFRNQRRPRLDVTASYGQSGVGGQQLIRDPATGDIIDRIPGGYGDALDQITGLDFPAWTLGLNFAVPLQNRAARAQSTIADLELAEARTALKELEQLVLTEVRTSARAVDTAAKQIDSARVSRTLAERNLDAERKRYENGMSTSFQVLEIQEDLSAARSREVSAVAAYRRALVEYYRSIGQLLDQSGVELAEEAAQE